MIQEVKVRLPWAGAGGGGDTGSHAALMTPSLSEAPAGLEGDGPFLSCPLGTPGSGPQSSLPQCLPHLVDTAHAPGLVVSWQESGYLLVPCPSAPGVAVRLGTVPQGKPVCPRSGLELKLEVQGEPAGVHRHPVNVSRAMPGLGGVGGKEEPPFLIPVGAFLLTGSSWAHRPPGKVLGSAAARSPAADLLFCRPQSCVAGPCSPHSTPAATGRGLAPQIPSPTNGRQRSDHSQASV